MSDTFTLKEDLYDRRDPLRPPVFVAGKGEKVTMHTATVFGLVSKSAAKRVDLTPSDEPEDVAVKAVKAEAVENKAIKPASTKSKK
ncbi:hypothetical protein UFOVP1608_27 [uncultured Caudovirales phage]|uniref:Uncharacterized protein n=1 Tax=uncultured Caudovirales phage TaxID=2100421 RepID=A0A6J5SSY5_9CAUD|nr:hypothetical protein UFOVP1608_27 [uncultured Caudovirales phage]